LLFWIVHKWCQAKNEISRPPTPLPFVWRCHIASDPLLLNVGRHLWTAPLGVIYKWRLNFWRRVWQLIQNKLLWMKFLWINKLWNFTIDVIYEQPPSECCCSLILVLIHKCGNLISHWNQLNWRDDPNNALISSLLVLYIFMYTQHFMAHEKNKSK